VPSVYDFLDKFYGARTLAQDKVVASGATYAQVVGNNPRRIMLLIVNRGDSEVEIATTRNPDTGQAVLLTPKGGSMALNARDDGALVSYDFYARSVTGATNNLYVVETTLQ